MYIPSSHPAATGAYESSSTSYLFALADTSKQNPAEKWSSFIGIVTAICGNVLISFALNTQRYAHIRMEAQREESHRLERRKRKKSGGGGYGTQQNEIAEERARSNRGAGSGKYHLDEQTQDGTETDPLIPSVDSLDSKKSSGSYSDTGKRDDEDDEGSQKEKSYLKSPIWWLGIGLMVVGEAGNFLAYGFAPASIVSPLGVVALISNCLIAPLLLHERFRWRDGFGVIVAVAGCVTVVLSASSSNPKLTPDSIWHLITRWEFETYLGITVALIIALCFASNRFGERTILIDLGLVGLFGGYTALSTKGVASLLSNTIWRVVTFPITYLLVAVLVGTAVMQIKYVNRALQRFNATMVIPTQFVMFTLSVIVGSAILYRDFERTTAEDAGKFVGGCALTFLGVYFITSGRGDESDHDDDETVDGEDGIDLVDDEEVRHETRERDDRPQSLLPGSSQAGAADLQVPDSPLVRKPSALSPAKAAAIHEQSAEELPQERPDGSRIQHPGMHATTSLPEVPTIDVSAARPKTPLRRGQSGPTPDSPSRTPQPSTPRRQPGDSLDPNTATPKLLKRQSVAGFLPGPLTSPLSSSLSAVVADSLRRGVEHLPRRPSVLRRRSTKKRDPNAAPLKRHSIASGEMDFDDGGDPENAALRSGSVGNTPIHGAGSGRVRSLSATIGDIFGKSPGKRRANNRDEGGEPGSGV